MKRRLPTPPPTTPPLVPRRSKRAVAAGATAAIAASLVGLGACGSDSSTGTSAGGPPPQASPQFPPQGSPQFAPQPPQAKPFDAGSFDDADASDAPSDAPEDG